MEMVTITVEEYKRLSKDSEKYHRLVGAGVDNWEGYDFAFEDYEEED